MTRPSRRGATAVEVALTMPLFVALLAGVFDLAWLAFQRSALTSSAALGCRVGALQDPGEDDAAWDEMEDAVDLAIRDALAATGTPCTADTCVVEVTAFGEDPGRSLGCTVRRDYASLTGLLPAPDEIEYTLVVRMEWQR